MLKILLKKVHFRQELSTSCVPAAARIVLHYLGINVESESLLRRILKTKSTGTNIFNLSYLKDEINWNLDAWVELGNLGKLEEYLSQYKIPIIVQVATEPLNYFKQPLAHAIVVVGFDEEFVIINDPYMDTQEIYIPKNEFIQAWSFFQNLMVVVKQKGRREQA